MFFDIKSRNTLMFRSQWFFNLCFDDGRVVMMSALYPTRTHAIDAVHVLHKQLRKQHGPTVRGFR